MFRRLLGEGALVVSFIPIYVDARNKSEERAKQVSNAVFTILFAVSVIICVACFVWMNEIMWYLVGDKSGYAAIPGKVEHTIYLSRIMIFYLLLLTTYAFHSAIANSLGYFFIPAIGPTLFNFGLILFTVTPHWELGAYAGSTQSWGVIFGGFLQMAVVIWLLVKLGHLPWFTLRVRMPEVGLVFKNMLPGLFGLGVFQVMTIVNTKFAARLSEGAQTYIYAADRILELPQSLIAVSLGAALLPRFSDLHSRGEKAAFLSEANSAVRSLFFLSLPAAVGMWVLARPITEVLFMRGSFGEQSANDTAMIVAIYSVLMLFSSLSRITAPAFYAMKNTRLPALVAFVVLLVHIFLGSHLVDMFGLKGLAYATSFSAILNILILQTFFYFWIGPLGYASIFVSVMRVTPGLIAMGLFSSVSYSWLVEFFTGVFPLSGARTCALGVVIAVSGAIYFYVSVLFGSSEAHAVAKILRRRLGMKT